MVRPIHWPARAHSAPSPASLPHPLVQVRLRSVHVAGGEGRAAVGDGGQAIVGSQEVEMNDVGGVGSSRRTSTERRAAAGAAGGV